MFVSAYGIEARGSFCIASRLRMTPFLKRKVIADQPSGWSAMTFNVWFTGYVCFWIAQCVNYGERLFSADGVGDGMGIALRFYRFVEVNV